MRIHSVLPLLFCLFLAACVGQSSTAGRDPDTADSGQTAQISGTVEIPVGMKPGDVSRLLGPADSMEADGSGRILWRYYNKRAEYVYVSNRDNTQTLVIGSYNPQPDGRSTGLPLLMTIVFDSAEKVVTFNFAQMVF